MSEINISGFSGANNLKSDGRFFVQKGIAQPKVVLNADVDDAGQLTIRKGITAFLTLAGAHSLWAPMNNLCMLCVAKGSLYRIVDGVATSVGTVTGPTYPLSYVEADGKIYMSNPYWQGVFDPSSNTVTTWGVPQPPGPMLLPCAGNLPAGIYHICMTNVVGEDLSGSSPITTITLTDTGGIEILNRPSGALVWATDKDDYQFYLVGASDKIATLPTVEPLPSFLCGLPPAMEHLCFAFGRIWGAVGEDVYYSEPYRYGLFRQTANKFGFDSEVTLIAKVPTGLFVGMKNRTVFLEGTEPSEMKENYAGTGSVKGTLAYCNNLPDLSSVLGTAEKGFTDVPVWMTTDGIVAGNQMGRLFNLTKNKLKMDIPTRGAAIYRNLEGAFHYLSCFKRGVVGSGEGFADADTIEAFTNGRLLLKSKSLEDAPQRLGFSDTATCQVYRGGVEI